MGFEIVVRPVVFPNIRPAPAQSVAPADDPTKGICTIHGSSGKHIDLPFSWSLTTSTSRPRETQRLVDIARIYQEEEDPATGQKKVNKSNYVDVAVAKKIWITDDQQNKPFRYISAEEAANNTGAQNVDIITANKMIKSSQQ